MLITKQTEMDAGLMPKWADKDFKVPDIAVSYWNMPEGKRTMKDLILYIRADEAGHVSFPSRTFTSEASSTSSLKMPEIILRSILTRPT